MIYSVSKSTNNDLIYICITFCSAFSVNTSLSHLMENVFVFPSCWLCDGQLSLLDIDLIMFSKYGDAPLCKQALQTFSTICAHRWWLPDEVFTSSLYDGLLFSRATSSHWTHWFYTNTHTLTHTHTHTHEHTHMKRRRHSVHILVHNEKPFHTLVHRDHFVKGSLNH